MSDEEIQELNKRLALFMGYRYQLNRGLQPADAVEHYMIEWKMPGRGFFSFLTEIPEFYTDMRAAMDVAKVLGKQFPFVLRDTDGGRYVAEFEPVVKVEADTPEAAICLAADKVVAEHIKPSYPKPKVVAHSY